MHGFIFTEIEKFVRSALGDAAWPNLLEAAGLARKKYENFVNYEDAEAVQLVVTASQITGLPVDGILEAFGRFVGKDLLKIYRPLIDPAWRTLEFLEHVEETIHKVVRSRNHAKPPGLLFERNGPREVTLTYASPRRMEALAVGIAHGVAEHYGEALEVEFLTRMADGAAASKIAFRLASPPASTTLAGATRPA